MSPFVSMMTLISSGSMMPLMLLFPSNVNDDLSSDVNVKHWMILKIFSHCSTLGMTKFDASVLMNSMFWSMVFRISLIFSFLSLLKSMNLSPRFVTAYFLSLAQFWQTNSRHFLSLMRTGVIFMPGSCSFLHPAQILGFSSIAYL